MFKKIFIVTLSFIFIAINTTVGYCNELGIDLNNYIPDGASKVGIIILKPVPEGTELDVLTESISKDNALDYIVTIDEQYLQNEKNLYYDMANFNCGIYIVIISYYDNLGQKVNEIINYPLYRQSDINTFIAKLNNSTIDNIYKNLYEDRYLYKIDLEENSLYKTILSNEAKQSILSGMVNKNYNSIDEITNEFNALLAYFGNKELENNDENYLNNANALFSNVFLDLINKYPEKSLILEELNNIEGLKNFIYDSLSKTVYSNYTLFYDSILNYTALGLIKLGDSSRIKNHVIKYNNIYNFNLDDASFLKVKSYAGEIFLNLKSQKTLINSNYTLNNLREAFSDCINDKIKSLEKNKSSTGRRGSSSIVASNDTFKEEKLELPSYNNIFKDISKDHWASKAVYELYKDGIINGMDDGSYYPNMIITRAEFVKMLSLLFKLKITDNSSVFKDLNINHWANKYIKAAVDENLINGISKDEFGPEIPITREDAVVMLFRFLKWANYNIDFSDVKYSDCNDISNYATNAVLSLSGVDIVNGVDENTFAPKTTMTRGMAAQLLYNSKMFMKGELK